MPQITTRTALIGILRRVGITLPKDAEAKRVEYGAKDASVVGFACNDCNDTYITLEERFPAMAKCKMCGTGSALYAISIQLTFEEQQ